MGTNLSGKVQIDAKTHQCVIMEVCAKPGDLNGVGKNGRKGEQQKTFTDTRSAPSVSCSCASGCLG